MWYEINQNLAIKSKRKALHNPPALVSLDISFHLLHLARNSCRLNRSSAEEYDPSAPRLVICAATVRGRGEILLN